MTKVLYQLEQIKFSYHKHKAIEPTLDINFVTIPPNTITAILGSNGAGKSTLLKILSFLEIPQQGKVCFFDDLVSNAQLLSLRRRVLLVAQKPYLLQGSVVDNVSLGLKFRGIPNKIAKQRSLAILEEVGIATLSTRNANDLSGGEVQKVALARALVLNPEVLILDEPFTHLDTASILYLRHVIENFTHQSGRSVIFSTHQQSHVIELATDVIKLVSGSIEC